MSHEKLDILIRVHQRVGQLHLNRPRALNAVNLKVATKMRAQLCEWQNDKEIDCVLVTGEGERAFCAGGDVKSIYMDRIRVEEEGNADPLGPTLLQAEYELVHCIANYTKPYVAYLDGITMGTGVGISLHGSHRLGNERTKMAMPETAIGFIPDVAASHFFPKLGPVGYILALTGNTVGFEFCRAIGWTTHHVPTVEVERVLAAIRELGLESGLQAIGAERVASKTPCEEFERFRILAESCFPADSVHAFMQNLQSKLSSLDSQEKILAQNWLETLEKRSPTSLVLTWELLQRGEKMDLSACLQMEYRVAQHCIAGEEFQEGVRAVLVDKDQKPKWNPDDLNAISPGKIASYFEPLAGEMFLRIS